MNEQREREAHATWEKEQWAAGRVARKVRDRSKAKRRPAPVPTPDLPRHPTEGASDQVTQMLRAAVEVAKERGKRGAARKARAWR